MACVGWYRAEELISKFREKMVQKIMSKLPYLRREAIERDLAVVGAGCGHLGDIHPATRSLGKVLVRRSPLADDHPDLRARPQRVGV